MQGVSIDNCISSSPTLTHREALLAHNSSMPGGTTSENTRTKPLPFSCHSTINPVSFVFLETFTNPNFSMVFNSPSSLSVLIPKADSNCCLVKSIFPATALKLLNIFSTLTSISSNPSILTCFNKSYFHAFSRVR